jgi:hypothetical protein
MAISLCNVRWNRLCKDGEIMKIIVKQISRAYKIKVRVVPSDWDRQQEIDRNYDTQRDADLDNESERIFDNEY